MSTPKRVLTPSKENRSASPGTSQAQVKKFKNDKDLCDDWENQCWDDDMDFDASALEAAMDAAVSPHKLDLSIWQRCVIEDFEMDMKSYNVRLLVKKSPGLAEDPETAECLVHSPWNMCDMKKGDIVSLLAKWQPSQNVYVIDKEDGFCVTNPDFLVSGTTVMGSLFCRRKTVLQERFRGLHWNNRVVSTQQQSPRQSLT
ncbi:GL15961 [Drosophila persimilis]|uniref:GL15961 n=1 Tax=Drosophila persimilis TaxID=7234 RepID=B4ISD1_DROPE|nr:GL15961 [Drosophila persimilis]